MKVARSVTVAPRLTRAVCVRSLQFPIDFGKDEVELNRGLVNAENAPWANPSWLGCSTLWDRPRGALLGIDYPYASRAVRKVSPGDKISTQSSGADVGYDPLNFPCTAITSGTGSASGTILRRTSSEVFQPARSSSVAICTMPCKIVRIGFWMAWPTSTRMPA